MGTPKSHPPGQDVSQGLGNLRQARQKSLLLTHTTLALVGPHHLICSVKQKMPNIGRRAGVSKHVCPKQKPLRAQAPRSSGGFFVTITIITWPPHPSPPPREAGPQVEDLTVAGGVRLSGGSLPITKRGKKECEYLHGAGGEGVSIQVGLPSCPSVMSTEMADACQSPPRL